MLITIPQQFNLFGQPIHVEFSDTLIHKRDAKGEWKSRDSLIILQADTPGAPKTEASIGHTFCHELIHAILSKMKWSALEDDEQFVEIFSALLYEALSSGTGVAGVPDANDH